MAEILYLVHRLPFPPNKGDKIRSYHLLRYLSERYDVHLGCFVDDENDLEYVPEVEKLCKSVFVRKLGKLGATLKSTAGFLSGEALTNPYYRDHALAKWVDQILRENSVSVIVAFSSPMGQYTLGEKYTRYVRIMDFVDIDSDKWDQYAQKSRLPAKWIYSREARLLSAFEGRVTEEFDAAVFVSENETEMFARQFPEYRDKLHTVCNGVAADYFDPTLSFESPFENGSLPIVFTGMMDYWPNVDAVSWFATRALAGLRDLLPRAEFWIVGASPTKEVLELSSIVGVRVTGKVPDVRPYLRYAAAVVAPLRIARGVQNKVLEALAMGCPVVCTPHAAAGLSDLQSAPLTLAESETALIDGIAAAIRTSPRTDSGGSGRDYVLERYDWERNLGVFDLLTARAEDRLDGRAGAR